MVATLRAGLNDECIFLWAHVQVQFATCYIDDYSNIDVHEARLNHEESRLTIFQWLWFLALINGFRIKAHFRFNSDLLVALMAIDWISCIRFAAF